MKKHLLKTLLTALVLLTGWGSSAWAEKETKTVKTWDFTSQTENGSISSADNGTVIITVASRKNMTCNLSNTGLTTEGLYFWDAWKLYTTYLRNVSGGDRIMVIPNLKANDVITFNSDADCIIASSNSSYEAYNSESRTYTITVTADGNVGLGINKNINIYKIAVSREVDTSSCENPTYSITGASYNKRLFSLACETEGATIYYSETELEADAEGWKEYANEVTTSSVTIYAYAKTSDAKSEVISFSTGAGSTITLNSPTITLSGMASSGDYYYPILVIGNDQSTLEVVPASTALVYKFNDEVVDGINPYTFGSTGTLTVTVSAEGYTSSSANYTVANGYIKEKTIDLVTLTADNLSPVWKKTSDASQLPAANWISRYSSAEYPLYIYDYTSESASTSEVIDGLIVNVSTASTELGVTPTLYVGAGMILPTMKVNNSDLSASATWNSNIGISIDGGTAEQIAVYTYPTNYGQSTNTTAISANENYSLYRFSDMLTKVEVYSPKAADDGALATAKEELLAVITYATSIEASELSDAISTAQTAYDATDATVESVGQAKADLVLAVKQYAKGALQPVLELAEEITENSGELAEGIQSFKAELDEAIETAKAALNDEEKTPEEIMTALETLSEKALVFASVTLDAAIGVAQAIDTEGKNGAEALAAAIQAAKGAIEAANPTIQGFYQAGLDLKQAIDDFNAANYNPNTALLNPSFELSGEETVSTAQGLSNSGGSYYGWTLPNMNSNTSNVSIGNASDCAGNAFGVPTAKDGSFYYFARRGWNSSTSGDATLSTTMTALPVGHYTLTMAYKGLDSWDDSHNSKGSYLKISVVAGETELGATQTKTFEAVKGNSAGANKFTGDANWQDASLEFNVETEGDVTLNIVHHLVGGVRTDVVIDNLVLAYKSFEEAAAEELAAAKEALDAEIERAEGFKTEARTEGLADYESAINDAKSAQELTSLEDVTQAIANLQSAELSFLTANLPVQTGTYYIYNPLTNKFLARGNAYGTAAVVADYGVAINVEAEVSDETPDGNYSLVGFDNNASYGFDEWMYADAGGNNVRTYTIAKSGDGYTITNTNNSKFVYVYLKEDGNKYRVAGNAIKDDNYTDDAQTVWQFIKPDAYNDMIAGRIAAEKTAAFAAAEIAEDADVVLGEPVELTFATGHGWTQTVVRTENNQPATNGNGTEMFQATGYYTQTVSGLPSGLYKVSIQAFYRNGGPEVCVTRYNTGYNTVLAYLDANGSKIQVKSWATDKGDDSDPNSMAQAKAKFDEGKYLSETYAYVGGDGNLNLTVYNPAHIGGGWFIVSNVKYAAVTLPIDPNALATEDDYTALTDAITAVEEKLGFLSGEYAPYNNIEALQLLAAAKSIDKLSDNLQTDVQNATTALTNAEWNVNDAEVNAIFDGSFEHDYSGQTGNINPIGWQRVKGAAADGYNVRLMNGTNAGLAATTSGKALFTKQSAYYGYADGYTMPLKANTSYKISFVYGGWGDCKKDGYVSMTAPDGSAVDVSPADLPVDETKADSDENSWKPYTALFKTGDAGEYVLGLRKKNYDTSGQSQYVYGDIRIFRATAADFKEQLAAEIAIADDVDVTANVGAAAFQIPASAVTSLSSAISTAQGIYDDADATIDEVLQAVENLKKAEDDYSNAELNAPAANKVYNIVNVTPDYNHAGKAVTFKSSATADLAGNTTSMGWNEEPGSVYPQGVKFTSVEGVKNTYILSYTRADGTDIYVSTGTTSGLGSSTSQIRPTTDAAKALKVRVEASTTDGVWYLWNTEADKRLGANGANDQGFFTGEANGNKYYDMKLQEAVNNEYNLVVDATNQYATLIVPFDATVPADIIAYSLSNANGNELELQPVTEIKANTPYVVYAEDGFTTTLAGLGAAFTENSYTTGWLTGVYAETAVPNGSYVLQNHDGAVAFYVVDTDAAQPKVQANHAYMNIPSGGDARAYYFGGEATAIGALKALTSGDAEIYDVNGRKQAKLQKGVNIIRTKDGRTQKVMVK